MAETVFEKLMKQAALTANIVKPVQTRLEAAPRLGDRLAPLRNIPGQYVSMKVADVHAFGIGQVRAPEATPPLVDLTGREEREEIVELAWLDEMHRISPTRWERLQSSDDAVAAVEARSLIEIGQQLQERNERLTEKLRWDAILTGQVILPMQQGDSPQVLTYPIPGTNFITAPIAWTDTTNADVVANLKAYRAKVATEVGVPGSIAHITSDDAELILANAKLRGYFNVPAGQPFRPSLENVAELVAAGTGSFRFEINDSGYRPEASGAATDEAAHVRYQPIGKVLVTPDYNANGLPIADTPNGQVEIQTGYNTGVFLHGPQSEIKMHDMSMQRFLRQVSRRIPRLVQPGAFVTATVR